MCIRPRLRRVTELLDSAGRTVVSGSATDGAGNVARGGFAVVVRRAPSSVPPLWRFPDDTRDATRAYASWTFDK